MTNIRRGLFASCATFGLIATANAQPTPSDEPTTPEPSTTETTTTTVVTPAPVVAPTPTYEPMGQPVHEEQQENWYKKYGVSVSLGGGVAGFTNKTLRDTTRVGGDWTVRLTIGSRSMLAGEAAYIGSAQSIDALGLDSDALLVSNGIQGNLRLNLINDMPVQPFVYGGAAWRRYTLARDNFNTSDVLSKDDVLEIPLGVGIAAKTQGFLFDARGEARIATNEDLLPSIDRTGAAAMHRWSINANVGYEF
ncbi:MAG: hypothetical protein H6Q90_4539 [Deltaproteobacteria bacterium]|nr:hypothetical protein [Deltaproteobacteria bacterium]